MEPLAEVRGLQVERGRRIVLHDFSFALAPGTTTAFLGPNGAGKTTTMLALLGLLPPSAGSVSVFGRPVAALGPLERGRIGFLPQDNGIMPGAHPFEWLLHHARLRGIARADAIAAAERLGVRNARRPVRTLSVGERRRVGAAAALMGEPRLVVLDEATMGLDPELRERVLAEIERVNGRGAAVLLSTHLLDEVERLAQQVLVIRDGVLIRCGELVERVGSGERSATLAALVGDVYRGSGS